MNYRNIIRNRKLRRGILSLLSFIPDSTMLMIQYRLQLNRKLDLKNPKRYTEKVQYYKINYKNPILPKCVDKYEVRDYIKSKCCNEYLTDVYGVFSNIDEIKFSLFPDKFVLKDTLGGGGNSVIIIKDKLALSENNRIKRQLKEWLKRSYNKKTDGREWPYYSGIHHRIMAEQYLEDKTEGLTDYKFFCFKGKIACVYVIKNRLMGEHGELAIMDREFNRLPFQSATQDIMKETPSKPQNYERMIMLAEKLSEEFPHVRVDLYNIEGRIFFGELTFYGASGYQKFIPDEFDYILGKQFDINGF